MQNFFNYVSLETKKLSNSQIEQISLVEKDMWAYWIWDYIFCNNCEKISSKQDIFWYLWSRISWQIVSILEEKFAWDSLKCPNCNSWNTEFIYDTQKNNLIIIDRYKNSLKSYLSVLIDNEGIIKWFCDWYIDNFENIYKRELIHHFWNIYPTIILVKIQNTLKNPKNKFFLSNCSTWTIEKYSNINIFYNLIRTYNRTIYSDYYYEKNFFDKKLTWIIELDINSNLNKIYKIIWSIKMWFVWNGAHKDYKSDIFLFENQVLNFMDNWFDVDFKTFLRNNRKI